ncbi:hypothetical protein [Phaeobacter sp. C3_T13_0]|uniref:hypothetical protein n=1 Tax=Phaeobacter cretensis TaxID=3342641 RepID=UPI0039BC8D0B
MSKAKEKKKVMVYDGQSKELMTIKSLSRDKNDLVITGNIFGSMPMKARIKPQEARTALKLLDFKTFLFLLTLLFRR